VQTDWRGREPGLAFWLERGFVAIRGACTCDKSERLGAGSVRGAVVGA